MKSTGLDYTQGKIPKLFVKIFIPTLFGMISNALITIADGIFVGRGVGPDGLAAINIVAPLFMAITGLGLMFGIGSSVVAGVAISHKDYERASVNMTQGIITSCVIVLVLSLWLLILPHSALNLLGCSESLTEQAMDYMMWLLPGMLFMLLNAIGMMVVRLDGSPKYAMLCNVIPAAINVVLDWLFVFPMGMGIKGSSIATSISVFIGGSMVIVYFLRFSYVIKFRFNLQGIICNVWKQGLIGSSAFISELAMAVMMLTGNYVFMRQWGDNGVAAYSIACYMFPLLFMMSSAVAQSAQPIISVNYGAGISDRVRSAFRLSLAVAAVYGLFASASISIGAKGIVTMFISPECEAGLLASSGLPYFALSAFFFALNIACIGYFQSVTRALPALIFTLIRGIIVLVPLFILLPRLLPGIGAWLAIPTSEAITFFLIISYYLWTHRTIIFRRRGHDKAR